MRAAALVLFLCTLPCMSSVVAAPQQTERIRVVDLMPAFFSAWNEGVGKPVDERVRLLKVRLLYPNAAAYNAPEFGLDDPRLAWYLRNVEPSVPAMRRMTEQAGQSIPAAERAFVAAFPDLKPLTVYILPSLLHFDGQTRNGTLFLGIDGLVAFERNNADLSVLMTHELFHIYHYQVNRASFGESGSSDAAVDVQAWTEGLATYVSARLNPNAPRTHVLMSEELAALSPQKTRALACAMEPKLLSAQPDDANLFFDAGVHPPELPARGGYLIGMLAAEQQGRTRTLRELALMTPSDVRSAIAERVRSLCGT